MVLKNWKKSATIIILIMMMALFGCQKAANPVNTKNTMQITSSAFQNSATLPAKYTCDGDNINPPLEISGTPENAKSLVLIVDDPDAPAGTWTHWTVWNIDPKTAEISENSVPTNSVEGTTSYNEKGYGSPCPPKNTGNHRYVFKIYAIDKMLNLQTSIKAEELYKTIENSILDKAEMVGVYSRQ